MLYHRQKYFNLFNSLTVQAAKQFLFPLDSATHSGFVLWQAHVHRGLQLCHWLI